MTNSQDRGKHRSGAAMCWPAAARVSPGHNQMKTSFKVGANSEVEVYWSQFGLEIYSVNGKEVLRRRSFSIRGSRSFVVTDGGRTHNVEIKIDFAPTPGSWISPGNWVAQAYVDGELAVADLTPKLRQGVRTADKIFHWIFVVSLIVLALLGAIYFVQTGNL